MDTRIRERPAALPSEGRPKKPAFVAKVVVELDFDLANALGNYLLDTRCENPALQALAWQLVGSD